MEAHNWVRWARRPGLDEYWRYRELFFGALVPPPGRRALEIGSGEGRVARDLAARGHSVVGLDSSPTLARYAKEAAAGPSYLLADAGALPFSEESFDLVVAYNSLMDVEDMPAAVSEAARVLTRRGRFCIGVTHPFADTGEFTGEGDARFTMTHPYFRRRRFEGTARRDGLTMTFAVGRTASRTTRSPSKAPAWSSSYSGSRGRQVQAWATRASSHSPCSST